MGERPLQPSEKRQHAAIGNSKKSSRETRATKLTDSQRKIIQNEAAALGIRPTEYLTMILTLSKTIRKSLAVGESFDMQTLLQWASNPMFTTLLTGLIGTTKSLNSQTPTAQTSPDKPLLPAPQTTAPPTEAITLSPRPSTPARQTPDAWYGWM